jgi:glycosyltransferase involved in cell wall biosynthesis
LRIAQVSQHYRPIIGGQEVYIANLISMMASAGHVSHVFQPDRGMRADDIVPVLRPVGIPRLIRGTEPYLFNLLLYLTQQRRLDGFDLIIAHYAFSAWALRKYAKKTIILSHGVEWHLKHMTWDDRVHERIARNSLEPFTHVVNDSHYLRHFGFEINPGRGFFSEVAPGKWFIPNCVDINHFQGNQGLAELKSRKIILVPRQITEDRGIDLAIKAFKLLSEGDSELSLCILGKQHPGAYLTYLMELIRRLDLGKRIFFVPPVENSQMPSYYSSAVVTLIPTLCREGTSLSALESMSCGTATVSTNVAGLADLPTVQVPPQEQAVASAIQETLSRSDTIGKQQQSSVRKTFNMENWAKAWLEVISKVGNAV